MQDGTGDKQEAEDWPGKAEGVPRPPTPAEVDEVSSQQHLITDEWAFEPPPAGPKDGA